MSAPFQLSRAASAAGNLFFKRPQEANDVGPAKKITRLEGEAKASSLAVYNYIPKVLPMELGKNTDTIISGLREAKERHKSSENQDHLIVHTPELGLSAYGCGDLHQTAKGALNQTVEAALRRFIKETRASDDFPEGISATIGFPYYTTEGKRVILHALISNGTIRSIKAKEELANNIDEHRGVEYEKRYFIPCEKGACIKLFGEELTYKEEGGIFSDQPVMIGGKKVALVICEEMFTGTDRIGKLNAGLSAQIDGYLKEVLTKVVPNKQGSTNLTAELTAVVGAALKGDSLTLPSKVFGFDEGERTALEAEFKRTFSQFQSAYGHNAQQVKAEIGKDIREKSRLYHTLKKADIVLVPNGSPSAAGKMERRSELFRMIGAEVSAAMEPGATSKQVFYNNNWGFQDGSIFFDAQVIHAEYTKERVAVQDLNSYHHGLVPPEGNPVPHYRTKEGISQIADAVDGTKYYSGKKLLEIRFGKQVAPSLYQKFYQATEYAYGNLCKHLASIPNVGEGQLLGRESKEYQGFFISQSGGFDSAHTVIVRAKAFELRMRELFLEKRGNLSEVLGAMKGELKLNQRGFDLDIFCSRFLMQRVNTKNDLKNEADTYRSLQMMCKALGIVSPDSITDPETAEYLANQVQLHLQQQNISSIGELIDYVAGKLKNGEADQQIELLSKLIIFHTVKASYLRTENNSIFTENAARTIAMELGVDFEVRNVDADFKTALLLEKGIVLSDFSEPAKVKILNSYSDILKLARKTDLQTQLEDLKAQLEILQHKGISDTAEIEGEISRIQARIESDEKQLEVLRSKLRDLLLAQMQTGTVAEFDSWFDKRIPQFHNWFESRMGLEIENIQARMRATKNWEIAYQYGLEPSSNPNTDESKMGYTTFIGDLHAGLDSSTADMRKTEILGEMAYMMNTEMHDSTRFFGRISHIRAIYNTFDQPPSAELQQLIDQAGKKAIQQTDEESYEMSYPELSILGDQLFALSENRAQFLHPADVYERFKNHSMFHGLSTWEVYSKIDKLYRSWYYNSFKRRAAPWQGTNSDVSVDHHANNRIEFGGFDRAVQFERAELLLTLLIEKGIVEGDLAKLKKQLLLDGAFQDKLQGILWSFTENPADFKLLIKRYKGCPDLLAEKLRARVAKGGLDLSKLEIKDPVWRGLEQPNKTGSAVFAKPIATRARDFAGNLAKAKEAILEAYHTEGQRVAVIPTVIGADLGDSLRRVSQEQIDLLLSDIARFSEKCAQKTKKKIAIVIGHPSYDANTSDRSRCYYQSASVIEGGQIIARYHATEIDNNHDMPGPSYDTRTFQAYKGKQKPIVIDGQPLYISMGLSPLPDDVRKDSKVKVIHIGALETEDQLRVAEGIGPKLLCSVNDIGSPSGIRALDGVVLHGADESAIARIRARNARPDYALRQDARWLDDYLPGGKITIALDDPAALYSLAVRKEGIEQRVGKEMLQEAFHKAVDIVTPYYKKDTEEMRKLWDAAEEVLGFRPKESDEKHPRNKYPLDSLRTEFLKTTLIGDINIPEFAGCSENDTWFAFAKELGELLKSSGKPSNQQLVSFGHSLTNSKAFKASLRETCRREYNGKVLSEGAFEAYRKRQINLLVGRIRDYKAHPETDDRLQSIIAWLLSARDGGEGQLILSNISRSALCCSPQDLVGGKIHSGGVTVTGHRSFKEMEEALLASGSKPKVQELFTRKRHEELTPGLGLTWGEVDLFFDYMKTSNFDIRGILDEGLFPGKSRFEVLTKLQTFALLWKKNNWARHTIPCSPHTKGSVDQQTSLREPLDSAWLTAQVADVARTEQARIRGHWSKALHTVVASVRFAHPTTSRMELVEQITTSPLGAEPLHIGDSDVEMKK